MSDKPIEEIDADAQTSEEEREAHERMAGYIQTCFGACRNYLRQNGGDPVIGAYVSANMASMFMADVPWAEMPQAEWDGIFTTLREILKKQQAEIKRPGTPEH